MVEDLMAKFTIGKNFDKYLAKLENLKNYKKGLMQQLFPQPVK